MGCPHVCGDNPRALACGLSYVQVDKHTYIGVNVAYLEIFRGKVGTCKGGIKIPLQFKDACTMT